MARFFGKRIIIDHNLKEDIDAFETPHCLITTENNLDYVEYIKYFPDIYTGMIEIIKQNILHGLCHNDLRVREKYQWVEKKWREREEYASHRNRDVYCSS